MSRKRWPLAAIALIAMVPLISACGSSAPAATGSGSSGASSTPGRTGNTTTSKREKAFKFVECMRAHGVPHFPYPDASGSFNFGVDVSAAVFANAVSACKALQPPGTLSAKRSPTQQSAALRFARCVRANGVPDFPDPVNGQPLIDTNRIPSSNQPGGMTILNATTHKCGTLLGLSAGGHG